MCVLKQNQRFADQRPRPSAQSMRCAAQLQPALQPESRQKRPAQTPTFDPALPNRPHWTIAAVPGCLRGQARNPGRRQQSHAREQALAIAAVAFSGQWRMSAQSLGCNQRYALCQVVLQGKRLNRSTAGGVALCCAAVAAGGSLMSVIGSENKKSRLATKRFFYLCE